MLSMSAIPSARRRYDLFTEAPIRPVAVFGAYFQCIYTNQNLKFVTNPERVFLAVTKTSGFRQRGLRVWSSIQEGDWRRTQNDDAGIKMTDVGGRG
jgi:hypothetical protein